MGQRAWPARIALVALAVLALAAPLALSSYAISTLTQILSFSLLVTSLVLVMGTAGIPSLGQAGFFGGGGYVVGLLATRGITDGLLALPIAAAAGATLAALTGWMIVRARGSYLLMLTLAIGELLSLVVVANGGLTGGSDGLGNIPPTRIAGRQLAVAGYEYWYVLAVFAGCVTLVALLLASPFGRTLRGVRDNEPRMRAIGYRTRLYRYAAFIVAGALSGIAGALWVSQTHYISPSDMDFHASSFALLAVIVGGSRSLWGAVVGSAVIVLTQNALPASWQGQGPLVLGLVLILAVYVLPGGAAGALARLNGRGRSEQR
jgi:branched-chain amino acid transport system permease protein